MQINLGDIFFKTWGYKTNAFDIDFAEVQGNLLNKRQELGKMNGSPYYGNMLGVEYYLPVEVQVGNNYAEALGVTNADGSNAGRWMLPFPIITGDIQKSKHIIDTELTEQDGQVSELINNKSFRVNVKGFLINRGNEFPEDDYTILNRLFDLNIPVRINNPVTDVLFMNYRGHKTVTFRNLRFMGKAGVKHVLPYELEMVGDVPFNLIIQ